MPANSRWDLIQDLKGERSEDSTLIIWTSVVFILHVSLRWKIAVSVGPPP